MGYEDQSQGQDDTQPAGAESDHVSNTPQHPPSHQHLPFPHPSHSPVSATHPPHAPTTGFSFPFPNQPAPGYEQEEERGAFEWSRQQHSSQPQHGQQPLQQRHPHQHPQQEQEQQEQGEGMEGQMGAQHVMPWNVPTYGILVC